MNKLRRKLLQEISCKLEGIKDEIELVKDEEDESRENVPENLQESLRYEDSEIASDNMDEAIASIEDALSALGEIK